MIRRDREDTFSTSLTTSEGGVFNMSAHKLSNRWYKVTILLGVLLLFGVCLLTLGPHPSTHLPSLPGYRPHSVDRETAYFEARIKEMHAIAEWKKPRAMKVIGLIFYGRRRFVSVLDCYLKVRVLRSPENLWSQELTPVCRGTWSAMAVCSTR